MKLEREAALLVLLQPVLVAEARADLEDGVADLALLGRQAGVHGGFSRSQAGPTIPRFLRSAISLDAKPNSARTASVSTPGSCGARPISGMRAAEARGRRRLHDTLARDEGIALGIVGIGRDFAHGEHGRETGIAAVEDLLPFGARLGAERLGEALFERGPAAFVVLGGQLLAGKPEAVQQVFIEPLLDGADRHPFAVASFVDVVVGRAGIENVDAALVLPGALRAEAVDGGHQGRRAVDHGGIDNLALAGALRLEQRADDAEAEQHAAAAEVAHEIEWRHGARPCARWCAARPPARCS